MAYHNATTLRDTPTYGVAKFGSGLVGGVLAVPGSLNSATGTIEMWLSTTNSGVNNNALGNESTSFWVGSYNGYAAVGLSGNIVLGPPGVAAGQSGTPKLINDGALHHVAVTFDGSNGRLFVDGVFAVMISYTGGIAFGVGTTVIGGWGANVSFDWRGTIDELRISSSVRYPTTPFTVATTPFVPDANTTALFHLDGDGVDATTPAGGYILSTPITGAIGTPSTITATLTGG